MTRASGVCHVMAFRALSMLMLLALVLLLLAGRPRD